MAPRVSTISLPSIEEFLPEPLLQEEELPPTFITLTEVMDPLDSLLPHTASHPLVAKHFSEPPLSEKLISGVFLPSDDTSPLSLLPGKELTSDEINNIGDLDSFVICPDLLSTLPPQTLEATYVLGGDTTRKMSYSYTFFCQGQKTKRSHGCPQNLNPEEEPDAQEHAKRRRRRGDSKSGSTRRQCHEFSDHDAEGSKPRIARHRQEEAKLPMAEIATTINEFRTRHLSELAEDDPITNGGRGSNLTELGHVECDASIMDGSSGAYGAIAAVPGVQNAIQIAACLAREKIMGSSLLGRIPPILFMSILIAAISIRGSYKWMGMQKLMQISL
ncbi:putative threonine aspartase [Platanthera zijinensis]|uniref:Threonine aspartase n=1 Tax=Platanthera zijinensis TaxID=2320716 RepID=A0AAP0BMN6_9ASPA